jgi:hypothetical protein
MGLRSKGFGAADNNEELVKIEAADITMPASRHVIYVPTGS